MQGNYISSKQIIHNLGNTFKPVTLFDTLKSTTPMHINQFWNATELDAVQTAETYLRAHTGLSVFVPKTDDHEEFTIYSYLGKLGDILLTYIYSGYRAPLNDEGRPVTNSDWEPNDVIQVKDPANDLDCTAFICTEKGTPGVWKCINDFRSSNLFVDYTGDKQFPYMEKADFVFQPVSPEDNETAVQVKMRNAEGFSNVSFKSKAKDILRSDGTNCDEDPLEIDATHLINEVPLKCIPATALERCTVVDDDEARFALTTKDVQNGDTVKVASTQMMYLVVDDTKLSTEEGYKIYTASIAQKLQNARTITFTGEVEGETSFDGSENKEVEIKVKTVNEHTVESDVPENAEFTDTKTSDVVVEGNPVTLSGLQGGVPFSEITVSGKNLLTYPYHETTKTVNGITFTNNGDGTVIANGTATADSAFYFANKTVPVNPKNKYYLSGCPTGGSVSSYDIVFASYDTDDTVVNTYNDTGNGKSVTVSGNAKNASLYIRIRSGQTVDNMIFRPQLEIGDTATDYEPPITGREITLNVCGKNLIGSNCETKSLSGIDFTVNADRSITLNGTSTAGTVYAIGPAKLTQGKKYRMSMAESPNGFNMHIGSDIHNQYDYTTASKTITAQSNDNVVWLWVPNGTTIDNVTIYPQIEIGDITTVYEPYHGSTVKITPDSNPYVMLNSYFQISGENTLSITQGTLKVVGVAENKAIKSLWDRTNSLTDAKTVNGHTVNKDVPAGAKFTDTREMYEGTCSSQTNSISKIVSGSQFSYIKGSPLLVKFTASPGELPSSVEPVKLCIGEKDSGYYCYYNKANSSGNMTIQIILTSDNIFCGGATYLFIWDGERFLMVNYPYGNSGSGSGSTTQLSEIITLLSADWIDKQITITGLTIDTAKLNTPIPEVSSIREYASKGIILLSETETSFTFSCLETPITDIQLRIKSEEVTL